MTKILREIVQESFAVCTTDGKYTIEETILGNGLDPSTMASSRCVRQVNKIGQYWGLCFYLAEVSRKYNSLFQNRSLHVLEPFATVKSAISSGQGKRTTCHVHAEMQLVVFYGQDLDRTLLKPRILGVSKSACFLCNIFIVTQGQFFITKTHGRLYHQWVIPDLATYTSNQREEYRRILATIDEKFLRISEEQASTRRRKYPMGSWLTLPNPLQPSPLSSNMGTVISEAASSTNQPPKIPQNKLSTLAEHHRGIPVISNLTSIPGQVPAVSLAPLSSTSLEPKSTHFSSSTSFEQSSSPSAHLNAPSPPMSIRDQESIYLSSTTIALHQLPIQRTITAISPFRLEIGKMSTQIEFEGAGEGRIGVQTIQELNPDFPGTLIDIGALLPDDSIRVENASRNEQLVLRLRYHRQVVQLCLQWV